MKTLKEILEEALEPQVYQPLTGSGDVEAGEEMAVDPEKEKQKAAFKDATSFLSNIMKTINGSTTLPEEANDSIEASDIVKTASAPQTPLAVQPKPALKNTVSSVAVPKPKPTREVMPEQASAMYGPPAPEAPKKLTRAELLKEIQSKFSPENREAATKKAEELDWQDQLSTALTTTGRMWGGKDVGDAKGDLRKERRDKATGDFDAARATALGDLDAGFAAEDQDFQIGTREQMNDKNSEQSG